MILNERCTPVALMARKVKFYCYLEPYARIRSMWSTFLFLIGFFGCRNNFKSRVQIRSSVWKIQEQFYAISNIFVASFVHIRCFQSFKWCSHHILHKLVLSLWITYHWTRPSYKCLWIVKINILCIDFWNVKMLTLALNCVNFFFTVFGNIFSKFINNM